ncbi:MAG: NAD+ synthase [Bacteroidales bacterium]|nr:NAD+ synthase [Bacteroidales bacterium]
MQIALAQINYIIGNFDYNVQKILEAIRKAKKVNVDLIIFSELSVCGYPPLDLLEHRSFVEKAINCVHKIASECDEIAAIVGAPSFNPNEKGKVLYNSAYFLAESKIKSVHHKSLLPTYDIFDEYRYFEPNEEFQVADFKGKKIAITICEDLWDNPPVEYALGRSRLYTLSPMKELLKQHPDLIVNISASPFEFNKIEIKKTIFTRYAQETKLPLFYVNQVGAHTDLIFDGGSMVISPKGRIVDTLNFFQEDFKVYHFEEVVKDTLSFNFPHKDDIEQMHDALILGIKDYFAKTGLKSAILGLSGGIDSAVATVLAAKALGNEHVKVLLMPSMFSSEHSVTDAKELAERLHIEYHIVPIQPIVDSILHTLNPLFKDLPPDVTEENIQARVRGLLLMAMSNKFGHILLNTSNKSEIAVGYGTLYGDMNGGLSVLGDVYKTNVYRLAHFINRDSEIIPINIITKAPSAELRPGQKDTDSLPPYELLDEILFRYIEQQKSLDEIIADGFEPQVVQKIFRMVNSNEYKRFQTPPILKVTSKAFGQGRKMPIVARY